jgi:hypothetical protein
MRIRCKYCQEYRVIAEDTIDLGGDIAMYIAHLIHKHPDAIAKATEIIVKVEKLKPGKFDWRYP